jgi:homoserine trans-succinylase
MPCGGYFDAETVSILTTLQERLLSDRRPGLLADFPIARLETRLTNTWRSTATTIYGNWLRHLCAKKNTGNRAYAMVF